MIIIIYYDFYYAYDYDFDYYYDYKLIEIDGKSAFLLVNFNDAKL